jgi:hypothetical protein
VKRFLGFGLLFLVCSAENCEEQSSDKIQSVQQEQILQEGSSQVGMPHMKNFRERKEVKDLYELRDQEGLTTYTYVWREYAPAGQSNFVFLCDSIGYPIPYATQFTNPQKVVHEGANYGLTMPQADPNGLFTPTSAEGSWVMCKDPHGTEVKPVYVEPRVIGLPFKL